MVKTIPMTKSDYLKYLKKQEVTGKPIVDKLGKINKTVWSSDLTNEYIKINTDYRS